MKQYEEINKKVYQSTFTKGFRNVCEIFGRDFNIGTVSLESLICKIDKYFTL